MSTAHRRSPLLGRNCYCINVCRCWKDFMLSWTCCSQTMVRGDQIRRLRHADVHCDEAHGPGNPNDNTVRPMTSLIGQRFVGKTGTARKRVAGMWRHRNWKKCGTGMIAAVTAVRFHGDTDIHFTHNNKDNLPDWCRHKLVSWRREATTRTKIATNEFTKQQTLLGQSALT